MLSASRRTTNCGGFSASRAIALNGKTAEPWEGDWLRLVALSFVAAIEVDELD